MSKVKKICRLVFSTNRLEYLVPTLTSHQDNIDFGKHSVYSILIDDYPKNRFDFAFKNLLQKFDFDELVLHKENKGLTKTWTEAWKYISSMDFDYVWHHEDDVNFKTKIKIDELISFLETNKHVAQINLKRNAWYQGEETEPQFLEDDFIFRNFRYNLREDYFWSMASLYPHWITKEPIDKIEGVNLGEYPVMKYLREIHNLKMAILKNSNGSHIIEHIGEYSQGKRVLEGEPGWDRFKMFDPSERYNSKTGEVFKP